MQNPLFQWHVSIRDSGTTKARCEFKLLSFSGTDRVECHKKLEVISLTSTAQPFTNSVLLVKSQTF